MMAHIEQPNHFISGAQTEPGRHRAAPALESKVKDATPTHKQKEGVQGDATRGGFDT